MVHPSIEGEKARARHRRLIGLVLASPFLIGGAIASFMPLQIGVAVTLAAICATLGLGWLGGLTVASRGAERPVAIAALVAGTIAVAMIIASAGGLASPVSVLLFALPFEAFWISRSKRGLQLGLGAAAAAIALQAFAGATLFAAAPAISAWHWLVPLAYGATLLPRLRGGFAFETATPERQDAALETIIDAVVLRMARNGEVMEASDKSRTMLQLPQECLFGTGLFDRIHIGDRIAYLCALSALREGKAASRAEVRIRLPRLVEGGADNYRPFLIEMLNEGALGDGFTLLVRENDEISDLRAALAEADQKKDSLEIAKGNFLAAVSHELRTPLNAIIGFSDMLLHEMFGKFADPRQKEYVDLVRQSGNHLLAVVNSILDVSKLEAGAYATNPEPFRFREAVEMCEAMVRLPASEKRIALATDIAADVSEIHADKRAVQQVLINLASNAIKFTPDNGQVTIGARRVGSRLHFWVSDTGIGIAEDDLSRIGKPFCQVRNDYTRQYDGAGLGLSLVKGLVALHDGTMSIESAPAEGTTVTISLPVNGPASYAEARRGELATLPLEKTKEEVHGPFRKAG
ncbi:ATP-binding protein [Mesorhizobium sp. SB112]|uniref:sensor histidine kinase n=1 Tax=Mesorhizobium sp. SB112 TaxID=3151853 RepID=UPI003266306A